MMTPSLQTQIDELEGRLRERRSRAAAQVIGIGQQLRARMTAPGTLLIAVGVGVIVEQGSRNTTWSLAPLLRGLNMSRNFFVTLTALVNSLDAASAS